MAFPCMQSTDKTMIIWKGLSLRNSAFHSDLHFQSISTETLSSSLCIHILIFPSHCELSAVPYIHICRPSSSCVAVNGKFLCLTLRWRWLDNMIATESSNLIGGSFTAKALLHFLLNSVFYKQKHCLTGNGPNTVWCAWCNPVNNMLNKN